MTIEFAGPRTTENFVAYIAARLVEAELQERLSSIMYPLSMAQGERIIRESMKGALAILGGRDANAVDS